MPLAPSAECPFCNSHIMGDRPGRNCSTTYRCGPSPFLSAEANAALDDVAAVGEKAKEYKGMLNKNEP